MIARLPDSKAGKEKEALAAQSFRSSDEGYHNLFHNSHHITPLLWFLEPWSIVCLLHEGICWATAYQNHKEASVYPPTMDQYWFRYCHLPHLLSGLF